MIGWNFLVKMLSREPNPTDDPAFHIEPKINIIYRGLLLSTVESPGIPECVGI